MNLAAVSDCIGRGLALSIRAVASRPDAESEEAWIYFATTAADEAYAAVMQNPPPRFVSSRKSTVRVLLDKLNRMDGEPEPEEEEEFEEEPIEGDELLNAAHAAAASAFRYNLPQLTGRRRTKAYLACVAVGVQRGYITGPEARAMLYVAQLALTANPKRQQPRTKGRKTT